MSMSWGFSHPSGLAAIRRTEHWRDLLISRYAPAFESARSADRRRAWNKALGVITTVIVSALGWGLASVALSHLLK